jgi:hypothetical protein
MLCLAIMISDRSRELNHLFSHHQLILNSMMETESKAGAMLNRDMSNFDPQHNDPDAKVILISSDDVSFRVHAWYGKRKRSDSHVAVPASV